MPVQNGITTEEAWNKVEGTQNYNINVAQIANFPYSCDLLGNLIKQSNISTFESVRQCSDISLISMDQVVNLNDKKTREGPDYQWIQRKILDITWSFFVSKNGNYS